MGPGRIGKTSITLAGPKDLGENVWTVNRALSQPIRYGIVKREDRGFTGS